MKLIPENDDGLSRISINPAVLELGIKGNQELWHKLRMELDELVVHFETPYFLRAKATAEKLILDLPDTYQSPASGDIKVQFKTLYTFASTEKEEVIKEMWAVAKLFFDWGLIDTITIIEKQPGKLDSSPVKILQMGYREPR